MKPNYTECFGAKLSKLPNWSWTNKVYPILSLRPSSQRAGSSNCQILKQESMKTKLYEIYSVFCKPDDFIVEEKMIYNYKTTKLTKIFVNLT